MYEILDFQSYFYIFRKIHQITKIIDKNGHILEKVTFNKQFAISI